MKRIQNLWVLLLTTVIGWLMTSCESSRQVLYGTPIVTDDSLHQAICLYGVPPGRWEKPQRQDIPGEEQHVPGEEQETK